MRMQENCMLWSELMTWAIHYSLKYNFPLVIICCDISSIRLTSHMMLRPQTTLVSRGPCHGPQSPGVCFVVALDWSGSWIVIVLPGKVNIIWIMIKDCLCWSDVFCRKAKPQVGICWIYFMLYWCHNITYLRLIDNVYVTDKMFVEY